MTTAPQIIRNIKIEGVDKQPIGLDLFLPAGTKRVPLLVIVHGFKGFKDWGHYNYIAEEIMKAGVAVCKFNFSHNGVDFDKPEDISLHEMFGNNTYSKEVKELSLVLDYLKASPYKDRLETGSISVAGHSRGGAVAFIGAVEDTRIKKLVLWAAPFRLDSYFRKESVAQWEKEGKVWVENKRTGEKYPLYKTFLDDYKQNEKRFHIPGLVHKLSIPLLLLHGDADTVVDLNESKSYYEAIPHSILIVLEGANHTFGSSHPFDIKEHQDPENLALLIENTLEFVTESFF
jgi:pimeloyl-ACP methyl ester carboxylesterase